MRRRLLVVVNGILLVSVAVAIVGVEAFDRSETAVEASVRQYAAAMGNSDLDAALAEIAPDQRAGWSDWVQGQLGNTYDVTGVAVHATTLLAAPIDVTVLLDIDRGYPDQFYQPTARVDVRQVDGRWYLAAPLLANQ